MEGITAQDLHVLGYIQQSFKGAILAVNKWDLVEVKDETLWTEVVRQRARFMPYIEILFISAKTGHGVEKVIPAAKRVYEERLKRPPTSSLNAVIREAVVTHLPPKRGDRKLKILKAVQTEVNPPTFVFSVNDAKLAHFSYRRYLENKLRESFGFQGTPLRLIFRSKGEKADKKT